MELTELIAWKWAKNTGDLELLGLVIRTLESVFPPVRFDSSFVLLDSIEQLSHKA